MPNPLAAIAGFLTKYKVPLQVAGSLYTNYENSRNRQSVGGNMEQQILTGKKYGIHPLEAIGANVSSTPAIPMQNPLASLGQIQPEDPDALLNRRIKQETLESLKRDKADYKWKYSIVKPATHPEMPGVQLWGFNPEYQMFGATSQAIVIASNSEQAMKMLMKGLTPEEQKKVKQKQKEIQQLKKKNYSRPTTPGGPQP